MRINKNNYEAFLLDLSEGNLSDELRSELNAFLASNPELEADLIDDYSLLEDSSEVSMNKDILNFDAINNSNRKHFFIAFHEGDLSKSEQDEVLVFISDNKGARDEFNMFSKLYLNSTNEVFKDKKSLHSIASTDNSKGVLYWTARIAAILIISFLVNALYQSTLNNIEVKYTRSENPQDLKPTLQTAGNIDFSEFFSNNKSQNFIPKNTASLNYGREESTHDNAVEKENSIHVKDNKDKSNFGVSKRETLTINRNPSLESVIASINQKNNSEENNKIASLPIKKIETPPSILAFIGGKAKEKNILNENGRPDFVSLLNKGSKSISGQDVLAKSETAESNSTIFKLGDLKIERITRK